MTPKCKCHDEPMSWNKHKRLKNGGHWRCTVKAREAKQRWEEKNKAPAGRVPCHVLRPYILDFKRRNPDVQGWGIRETKTNEVSWMQLLGARAGISARLVREVLNGEVRTSRNNQDVVVEHVSFDIADKIVCVCAPTGPWAWREDPKLHRYYRKRLPKQPWEKRLAA